MARSIVDAKRFAFRYLALYLLFFGLSIAASGCPDPDGGPDPDGSSPTPGTPSGSTATPTEGSATPASTATPALPSPTPVPAPTPWLNGHLSISGAAYFFNITEEGQISQITDVRGAEVYVVEVPVLRVSLSPDNGHTFRLEGFPEDVEITLALVHPQYYPTMTRTFRFADEDLTGVTFQAVPRSVANLAGPLLGMDLTDDSLCHMATTVTALGGNSIWAIGEPGVEVELVPPVAGEQGPYYFNTSTLPDPSLTQTTTDGGVLVLSVDPGWYTWIGHKEGVVLEELKMMCLGGWLTNASPPWGMNVLALE